MGWMEARVHCGEVGVDEGFVVGICVDEGGGVHWCVWGTDSVPFESFWFWIRQLAQVHIYIHQIMVRDLTI